MERSEGYAGRMVPLSGTVWICVGSGDLDRGNFPGGSAPVSCCIFAHWLRLCLYAQVGKEDIMKIVVVKSPKFLAGLLRMLFGMKE